MASALDRVGVHADALDKIADAMKSDSIGLHMTRGHVAHLRAMASAMRIDKAQGRVPSEWSPGYYAAADNTLSAAAAAMSSGVAAAMGGLQASGLPAHIDALVRAHGVQLPPSGPITAAELQAKLEASGMMAGDRIVVRHTLAALGRLAA